jgi:hypothetical protein
MLADLWGMVNTIIIPNGNDWNADIGNGSSSIKGGGGDNDLAVPPPPPPPLVVLVVIVAVFDATSLLPAMAPVNFRILPPLGSNTQRHDRDHGGGIPLTARVGIANAGSLSIISSMITMFDGIGLRCIPSRWDFCHQRNSLSLLLLSLLIPHPPLGLSAAVAGRRGGEWGTGGIQPPGQVERRRTMQQAMTNTMTPLATAVLL